MTDRPKTIPTSAANSDTADKIEHPQEHFQNPAEVVIDPLLSKDEKLQALEGMEQDAKQKSAAAAEGMTGGDEESGLPDVLTAKDALDQPPFELAISVVLQGLRAKLDGSPRPATRALITRAIEAIEAAGAAVEADGED